MSYDSLLALKSDARGSPLTAEIRILVIQQNVKPRTVCSLFSMVCSSMWNVVIRDTAQRSSVREAHRSTQTRDNACHVRGTTLEHVQLTSHNKSILENI